MFFGRACPRGPDARHAPRIALLLAAAAVAVFASEALTGLFEYDRAAIATGQLWRLLTSQWTHWNFDHLFWDALAFAILGAICERISRRAFVACVCLSAVAIPAAVWSLEPGLASYRGLSGIDSALFILLVALVARQCLADGRWGAAVAVVLCLAAFATKTAVEIFASVTVFVDSHAAGFVVVPLAHVVGAAIGAAVAAMTSGPSRLRRRTQLGRTAIASGLLLNPGR